MVIALSENVVMLQAYQQVLLNRRDYPYQSILALAPLGLVVLTVNQNDLKVPSQRWEPFLLLIMVGCDKTQASIVS